jgi:pimeloyl-ACP methyl ester carboxylesterase
VNSPTQKPYTVSRVTNRKIPKDGKSLVDEALTLRTQVHDIEISYKLLGNGEPVILIMGFGGCMNNWDANLIKVLSSCYTTIIFDNRGVGLTTIGTQKFSINQFANDTVGLLDALDVKRQTYLDFLWEE